MPTRGNLPAGGRGSGSIERRRRTAHKHLCERVGCWVSVLRPPGMSMRRRPRSRPSRRSALSCGWCATSSTAVRMSPQRFRSYVPTSCPAGGSPNGRTSQPISSTRRSTRQWCSASDRMIRQLLPTAWPPAYGTAGHDEGATSPERETAYRVGMVGVEQCEVDEGGGGHSEQGKGAIEPVMVRR